MNPCFNALIMLTISSLSLITSSQLTLAENQSNRQQQTSSSSVIFQPKGEPTQTAGGGTRNDNLCSQDQTLNTPEKTRSSLIAFVPSQYIGLTVASHPTVWIQLSNTSAKQIIFNIQEKDNPTSFLFQSIIPINNQSNLIPLSLSLDSPELETGKVYQWSVTLICGETPHPNDPTITATIERVSLTSIPSLSDLEMAAWYAENGIWYDALNQLGILKQNNPNNSEIDLIWQQFLKSGEN